MGCVSFPAELQLEDQSQAPQRPQLEDSSHSGLALQHDVLFWVFCELTQGRQPQIQGVSWKPEFDPLLKRSPPSILQSVSITLLTSRLQLVCPSEGGRANRQ